MNMPDCLLSRLAWWIGNAEYSGEEVTQMDSILIYTNNANKVHQFSLPKPR